MESPQICAMEIVTAREGKAEEVKQMLLRASQLECQIPGIARAWVVQDQRNPCEIAQMVLIDAARYEEALREVRESEWHKSMVLQSPELMIEERKRMVVGPSLF